MSHETSRVETEIPAGTGAELAPRSARDLIEKAKKEGWLDEEWDDGTPYDPDNPHHASPSPHATPSPDATEPHPDTYAETRLPDDETPAPSGLVDPLSPDLIFSARHVLAFLLNIFRSPKLIASSPRLWQWRKFELLDWLRPLELLLRRLLLVEALSLLVSQALPPRRLKAGKGAAGAKTPAARKPAPCDPARPETWRVSFNVIPRAPQPGRRRYPPNPNLPPHPLHPELGADPTPLRFRRVLHDSLPLARRLEAAIRVVVNPAPFARRLALRLRARANPNAELLLVDRRRPGPRMLTDALLSARDRAAELFSPVWEMFWSSA